MKKKRAPLDDGITSEILRMSGTETIKSVHILLSKCLTQSTILATWKNAQVVLFNKMGDDLRIENYRPNSLLLHAYKVLT